MNTVTWGQLYGASLAAPGREGDMGPGPSEVASGPEGVEEIGKPDYGPALTFLAILGGLAVLRLAWEYAGGNR